MGDRCVFLFCRTFDMSPNLGGLLCKPKQKSHQSLTDGFTFVGDTRESSNYLIADIKLIEHNISEMS